MRSGYAFFKATAIGGAFFILPIVVISIILGKALSFMRNLALLFSGIFEIDSVNDVLLLNVLCIAILILTCFIAGILAKTRAAKHLVRFLEASLLDKIPLYLFVKSMVGGDVTDLDGRTLKPIWLRLDDLSQLAFEVERQEDGNVVVFLPGAPNPWSGSLALAEPTRVTSANLTMVQAIQYQSRLGSLTKAKAEGGISS